MIFNDDDDVALVWFGFGLKCAKSVLFFAGTAVELPLSFIFILASSRLLSLAYFPTLCLCEHSLSLSLSLPVNVHLPKQLEKVTLTVGCTSRLPNLSQRTILSLPVGGRSH